MAQNAGPRWGIAAGYAIAVGVGIAAVYLEEGELLLAVLIVAAGLTAILYADFSRFRIGGKGFGVEAERQESADQLQDAVTQIVTVTAAREGGVGLEQGGPGSIAAIGSGNSEALDQLQRRAIEKVVANAYRLGWTEAQLMKPSQKPPALELEWSQDGLPRLAIKQHMSRTIDDLGDRA